MRRGEVEVVEQVVVVGYLEVFLVWGNNRDIN